MSEPGSGDDADESSTERAPSSRRGDDDLVVAVPEIASCDDEDDDEEDPPTDPLRDALEYWTPERMAAARPRPMPIHPDDPTPNTDK